MTPDVLSAFPRLATLEPESAAALVGSARSVTIPPGTVLFRDGAECSSYVLVVEGSIRVQKMAESGREIVLYRVERGQSCVLTTNCLLCGEEYAAEGIAESEVTALVLPAATFRSLLAGSEVFRELVFSAYASRIADLLMLIEEVAFGRIDVRLSAWLGHHADPAGAVRSTHQELAVELGTAREVVSRQLKDFERRGWLSLFRGRIEIKNRDALAALAERL